jgi:MerR family redox-sensitive transcriptional activator SoxR
MGQVVARTGVPASALRFYEREGLIFAERDEANRRFYRRHMLRRISLILAAKRLGIDLTQVAEIFAALPALQAPTHKDWQHASRSWRSVLSDHRRYLENLDRGLDSCIGCGCLSMKACRILNPRDGLGKQGQGPMRLEESWRRSDKTCI